jgi:hypothetical protein
MNSANKSEALDELTKQVIDKEYGQFCAEQDLRPSADAATLFAIQVTGSGLKEYHGMPSDRLVQLLSEEFRK